MWAEDPLQALDDLNTCLQSQLLLVEKDSRYLAETYGFFI